MSFKCELCNYESHDKFNYKRHENSNKHKEKVQQSLNESYVQHNVSMNESINEKFKCQYCNGLYTTSANLARHKKSCNNKNKLENEYTIKLKQLTDEHAIKLKQLTDEHTIKLQQLTDQFTSQINELNTKLLESTIKLNDHGKLIEQKDDMINVLKSEVTYFKSLVNNSGSMIKSSMSTMAYVIKNYSEAPALEYIKDFAAIRYEQDNEEFVDSLIFEHNNNKLHMHIGDFIIKTYKKDDPSQQSLWNSDTSRLTYLIRDIIAINKLDWKVDKKGVKTTKFIIEPILDYVDKHVRNYIQGYKVDYSKSPKEAERQMMKLKSGNEILKNIENRVLNDDILKYITPHFYLTKNDELIAI